MTRYSQLKRLTALGVLLAAGMLALSAVPSGATIVCPSGIQPPSPYCANIPTGRLELLSHRLIVKNGYVSVPLQCASRLNCHGRFTIGTRAKVPGTNSFARVLCATTFFTIPAHRIGTVRTRVHGGCITLLQNSPHHIRSALLTSNPRTSQKAVIAGVVLVLR